ncbi:MAG: serine/threonine-protein kinase [Patescibacteria group bacterium]
MRLGQYEVIRKIAEGAFGRTFLGTHVLLGEPVCLKQEKTGDPTFQDLFRQEAKLLWSVHHVSLPSLKDYLEPPGYGPVAVMSFVPGDNLHTLVETRGPIADEHICWILQRVLDALSYLHFQKIVHCDIKPANIILDIPVHNAVLVDFGLCLQGPTAQSRPKGGTPFFLPPEFLQGLPPIPASDLYSLGMTAVFLCGGDIHNAALPTDMDPRLQQFISAMIRRDPMARPQDARALNAELTRLRKTIFGRTETKEVFKLRGGIP